jgi:hypothetical protein
MENKKAQRKALQKIYYIKALILKSLPDSKEIQMQILQNKNNYFTNKIYN